MITRLTSIQLIQDGDLFKFLEGQKFNKTEILDTDYISTKIHDFVENFTDMAFIDEASAKDMAKQYLAIKKQRDLGMFEPINYDELEEGYYQINNTKKVLCWNCGEWVKPEKDRNKRFGSYISKMTEQPKNVKIIKKIKYTEFNSLYQPNW